MEFNFFENFQEPKTRTTFFLAIFCINFTWKIVVQPPYFKVGKLFLPKSLKFNDVQVFKATYFINFGDVLHIKESLPIKLINMPFRTPPLFYVNFVIIKFMHKV